LQGGAIGYTVNASDEFAEWWSGLEEPLQDTIAAHIGLLEAYGPQLGRPYADTLYDSALSNLKELRVQHQGKPYRILFAFDPLREALLLVGGNKEGDRRWYRKMIPLAEAIFKRHLADLEDKHD
jgi:hypothetical protein